MKNPWEWVTEADIQELIQQKIQENMFLDYKQIDSLGKSDGKKKEISKDISSFANSGGGTLIYGVVEDGQIPTKIDEGVNPKEIDKEWLENVITTNIHR